ncbi:B-cell differentiation antigen CD72 isoform X2 [Tupaia chinensis]|uniref:B-cell differentiation antigen CD72 isoform X2 n=1 Tax=Tupaia chinensis TaxID=246437 RepID=UPI000FFCA47E|nr:B-cell differentiation antigen CD72 isoform X2 [Tupaia chinensis]
MADAITYADLRFVKVPLKKSVSGRLGQDPEADEDGELTYENVQVTPVPGGPLSSASCELGDKAGLKSEQPTASWNSVTSPAARRILPCCAAFLQYLLLGLLFACLLLVVAAICLGVRYLQVSQQLQQMNRVLEATNSSLRQQLYTKITQLGQKEESLQESRRDLARSQEALQVERGDHQAAAGQLQACQLDREKTKEALQNEEVQKRALEQRLRNMQDTLKPFFTCSTEGASELFWKEAVNLRDTCCPVGWIPNEKSCFHISLTRRSWEESRNYCKSLSSDLATFKKTHSSHSTYSTNLDQVLSHDGSEDAYWIAFYYYKNEQQYDRIWNFWDLYHLPEVEFGDLARTSQPMNTGILTSCQGYPN